MFFLSKMAAYRNLNSIMCLYFLLKLKKNLIRNDTVKLVKNCHQQPIGRGFLGYRKIMIFFRGGEFSDVLRNFVIL